MRNQDIDLRSPCLFVITGIMASGKSTVAQLLAEKFEKSVHVRGDLFRKMIVSGRVEMAPDASEEAYNQLMLRYKLAAATVDEYFKSGFHVVVQDVILGPELQAFVDQIQSRPLFVIVLNPNVEAVAEREQTRLKKGYGDWTPSNLNQILESETPKIGMWLDSSDLTPEETVEAILERAVEEAEIR